jgi:hypothetical protein
MQEAVGATPPRANVYLYYGRDINEKRVQSIMGILAEQTWDTDEPPDAASPALLQTARTSLRMLQEEHDVTMYDPHCWTRTACWFAMRICLLILDGRLREANELLCRDETRPELERPAQRFLPALRARPPPVPEDELESTRAVVSEYTRFMTGRVDNLYQRALVEIHLDKLHGKRCRVYDGHATLVLIDAVFSNGDTIDVEHPMYGQLREFVLSRPQDHYDGHTSLPYLPHLHAMCRWIAYANQLGQNVRMVMAVGNSRCREAATDVTGICWASERLCGFFSAREQVMADAVDVWNVLVMLNRRYVPT